MLAVYFPLSGYIGFAVRSRSSRRPHIYPYYHCNILNITFKMESPVKHLQSIFGRKRDNRSTCHLFSQDTDITSRSVSNRSSSTSKLGVWSFFKSTSPMILRPSFNGLMVVLFVMFVLFRYGLPFDCASFNCIPAPFASKITVIVIAGPLVLNIMTSSRFHSICPA